jgi:hypothetical protein
MRQFSIRLSMISKQGTTLSVASSTSVGVTRGPRKGFFKMNPISGSIRG